MESDIRYAIYLFKLEGKERQKTSEKIYVSAKSLHIKWIVIGNNNVIFISNWCMQDNNYYIINHS